jgi:GTP-binding protein HflX
VEVIRGRRDRPDAKTFAGSGKVEEIQAPRACTLATVVVFDRELSASQVRNLERALAEGNPRVRVFDRTDVILDIFAQRARTNEGKLQVELARLEHLSTRLVKGWTHLERQRGSLGKTGGPGEKQIELDRRMIGEQVKKLKERLKKVGKVRATQRAGRARSGLLRVAIVGYTNAGKSTLFNRITRAKAYVADKLFATLDTTTRRVYLGRERADHPLRYGGIHPRPAALAGRGLQGHARGIGAGRPPAARGGLRQPPLSRADRGRERGARRDRRGRGAANPRLQPDRSHRAGARSGARCLW